MNSIVSSATPARPSAAATILAAGIASAALDLLFACVFYGIRNGITPLRIFQTIGSGWFGTESFQMGWTSGTVGILSHFGILIVAAALYFLAARRVPLLTRQALWCGLAYGAGIYVAMNYIVVPLSNAPHGKRALVPMLAELASHLFFVGCVIAYLVRRHFRAA